MKQKKTYRSHKRQASLLSRMLTSLVFGVFMAPLLIVSTLFGTLFGVTKFRRYRRRRVKFGKVYRQRRAWH